MSPCSWWGKGLLVAIDACRGTHSGGRSGTRCGSLSHILGRRSDAAAASPRNAVRSGNWSHATDVWADRRYSGPAPAACRSRIGCRRGGNRSFRFSWFLAGAAYQAESEQNQPVLLHKKHFTLIPSK
jgi:hypothetical protein